MLIKGSIVVHFGDGHLAIDKRGLARLLQLRHHLAQFVVTADRTSSHALAALHRCLLAWLLDEVEGVTGGHYDAYATSSNLVRQVLFRPIILLFFFHVSLIPRVYSGLLAAHGSVLILRNVGVVFLV